jgi:hypothetical protein
LFTKIIQLSRNNTPAREEYIQQLTKLKTEKDELRKLLEAYKDSDPDVISKEKKDIKVR